MSHDLSNRGDLIAGVASVAAQWTDRQKTKFPQSITPIGEQQNGSKNEKQL
jgi:hypothetical protein